MQKLIYFKNQQAKFNGYDSWHNLLEQNMDEDVHLIDSAANQAAEAYASQSQSESRMLKGSRTFELRLGNIVKGGDNLPHVVRGIKADFVDSVGLLRETTSSFLAPDDTLVGMPITDIWLSVLGFKDNRILLTGDGELEIRMKGKIFVIWPTDGMIEGNNYQRYIDYVHQLQNLCFALTGEELTIDHSKLTK